MQSIESTLSACNWCGRGADGAHETCIKRNKAKVTREVEEVRIRAIITARKYGVSIDKAILYHDGMITLDELKHN